MTAHLGRARRSREQASCQADRPGRPGVRVEPLRPGDRGREQGRDGGAADDRGDACVGERRPGPPATRRAPRRPSASSPTPRHVATAARSSTQRAGGFSLASTCGSPGTSRTAPSSCSRNSSAWAATWRMAAPAAYAQICNAVYGGVHAAGGPERVACGATAPRGHNDPTGPRPSIAPLTFLQRGEADGPPRLRRLGAPPVLRRPVGDPDDAQRRLARDRARRTSTR